MPGKVERLELTEAEERQLRAVSAGEAPVGDDVRRRADVLLDLASGLSVRATAAKRGVRVNTASDILRRWRERGPASLADAPRSGRPRKGASPEEVEASADAFVDGWRASHGGAAPTVAEAAEGMGCGEGLAREALRARGLVRPRGRSWRFAVGGATGERSVALAGLYVSHSQQVAAVLVGDARPVAGDAPGSLTTGSPDLASELGREAGDDGLVALADALRAAASVRAEGRGEDALSFARGVLATAGEGQTLHLLACGDPVVADGRTYLAGAQLDVVSGVREWASALESLLRVLCAGDAPLAAGIASGAVALVRGSGPKTEPFAWTRAAGAPAAADAPVAAGDGGGAEPPAPGTVEVTARVSCDDGGWVTYRATVASGVTQAGFGTTPQGYAKSAGLVSRAVASAVREAERGATEAYLASLARKTS